jgi:predicted small secreted protein
MSGTAVGDRRDLKALTSWLETTVMKKNRVRLGVAVLLVVAPLALTACNTVSGAGRDLEETSENTKKVFTGKSTSDAGSKSSSSNDTTQASK